MTATANPAGPTSPTGPRESHGAVRLSAPLEEVILEIARSERALDELLNRAERLHRSNIGHSPASCLVCFSER